jgi:lactoylglutathione lyase
MKTLLTAYHVRHLDRSVDFYAKVGFDEIGRVSFEDGSIRVMLNLPGNGEVATLELVYDPKLDSIDAGTGFSHIAVQVDDLNATLVDFGEKGVTFDSPQRPAGDNGPKTLFRS